MRPLRATWTEELQKEIFKIQHEWTLPKLIAKDIISVQPMVFPTKIYKPYIPLIVHPYPEQEEFLGDEDFLV